MRVGVVTSRREPSFPSRTVSALARRRAGPRARTAAGRFCRAWGLGPQMFATGQLQQVVRQQPQDSPASASRCLAYIGVSSRSTMSSVQLQSFSIPQCPRTTPRICDGDSLPTGTLLMK